MAETKKIKAKAIIQIMGSPKEHIENSMKLYIDKIDEEYKKTIKVLSKEIEEAKEAEDNPGTFDVFAEIEMEIEGIQELAWWAIDYMPTSIEIIEPDMVQYRSEHLTGFMNDLIEKLHRIGNELKKTRLINETISKNGVVLIKNFIKAELRHKEMDAEELSKLSGAPKEHIQKFLASLEKEGKIAKKGDRYMLNSPKGQ